MQSLINLIMNTIVTLLNSFGNMNLFSSLNFFTFLTIIGIVIALIDIIGRLAHD